VLCAEQVHFKVKCQTVMGQRVAVVGNHPSLGSWNVSQAQRLKWSPGHIWQGSISLEAKEAPRAIEYKAVLLSEDGEVAWEQGPNSKVVLEGASDVSAKSTWQG
jgi:alpha-amylase